MSDRLLDIFERSGDANIGQTLLRLAALAETAHRHQAAMGLLENLRKDQSAAEGLGRRSVVAPPRTRAGGSHTEVGP